MSSKHIPRRWQKKKKVWNKTSFLPWQIGNHLGELKSVAQAKKMEVKYGENYEDGSKPGWKLLVSIRAPEFLNFVNWNQEGLKYND